MLGKKLKELRKNKNLTLKGLGMIIGVSESTISLYETNRRRPSYDILIKLANFFQISLDYLLNRDNNYILIKRLKYQIRYLKQYRKEHLQRAEKHDYNYQKGLEKGTAIGLGISLENLKNILEEEGFSC